jgi:hypothetical protein
MGFENFSGYGIMQRNNITNDLETEIYILRKNKYEELSKAMETIPIKYGKVGRRRLITEEKDIKNEYKTMFTSYISPNIEDFLRLHKSMRLIYPIGSEENIDALEFMDRKYMNSRVRNFNIGTLKNWMEQGHKEDVISYLKATYKIAEIVNKKKYVERYDALVNQISTNLIKETRLGKTKNPEKNIHVANELRKIANIPIFSDELIEGVLKDHAFSREYGRNGQLNFFK